MNDGHASSKLIQTIIQMASTSDLIDLPIIDFLLTENNNRIILLTDSTIQIYETNITGTILF